MRAHGYILAHVVYELPALCDDTNVDGECS